VKTRHNRTRYVPDGGGSAEPGPCVGDACGGGCCGFAPLLGLSTLVVSFQPAEWKCSAKIESFLVRVCDHCARKRKLRTQKVQATVDPALGIGLFAVELAQTRLAGPVANRRDALDSSRLYKSRSALRTPARE
jgi:hypothetical protein